MKTRRIRKVAVLGSGIMGSQIACHFANVGVQVLLLDIAPNKLADTEKAKGLNLENKLVRNRIVNTALQTTLKSNPSPIYSKSFAKRITTGNFDDDLAKVKDADWIIEVIIENLDIKHSLFEKVEKFRTPGTLISSNTSGIPIHLMANGRSNDFKSHFFGSHFFNPPRYLKLLELIPTKDTNQEVLDFTLDYGERFLGKTTVLCKDTPAFIANRIGVYSIMDLFHNVTKLGLTVEEVDKLTGSILGRAKSATFRTADVVGLDTLVKVATGVEQSCPNDEKNKTFELPDYLQQMVARKWLGSKTKQGFYKKVKSDDGSSKILSLNLETLEYQDQKKVRFNSFEMAKAEDNLVTRTKILFNAKDVSGEFYRTSFTNLFTYVSNRIPEISDTLYQIDEAVKAGFGWKLGPFETWDAVGLDAAIALIEQSGNKPKQWVYEMKESGIDSFYKIENGLKYFYDIESKSYKEVPGQNASISLEILRPTNIVWGNSGTTITDLGDGILNLEFHTKMNTIGSDVIQGINKAFDLAEESYKGLVISNEGDNFSAGANVGQIFMMAVEQDYDELAMAIQIFQKTMMRARYSSIPVVSAPHNLTLGGATELSMHADKVVAHSETYMGLVEFGVGVIPGGGGTKEFAVRLNDEYKAGDIKLNQLRTRFLTIGQAKVSTSAEEAFELGYLRRGVDEWIVNRKNQLAYAKKCALELADKGYTMPKPRTDIEVLGNEGLGIIYSGVDQMQAGNYISEHDQLIAEKLGFVMCGGDLSQPTKVSEDYLLALERKAFVELCATRKTLERLQSIIQKGKVLRN